MRNDVSRLLAALVAAGMLSAPAAARAATRTVPAQYPTIGAAVAAASNGDTILVSDGTYSVSGNFSILLSKSITIRSVNGAAKTILHPGSSYFLYVAAEATIQGFTIENASFNTPLQTNGTASIVDCLFTSNAAFGGDAASIAVYGGTTTVDGSSFTHNSGGAAIAVSGASLTVTKSTFTDNTVTNAARARRSTRIRAPSPSVGRRSRAMTSAPVPAVRSTCGTLR